MRAHGVKWISRRSSLQLIYWPFAHPFAKWHSINRSTVQNRYVPPYSFNFGHCPVPEPTVRV